MKLKLYIVFIFIICPYFIIGQIKNSPYANEDYGYIFEKIILQMTKLNLGTCWLGGTFSREEIGLNLDIDKDSFIPAITPVGFCKNTFSKRESIIRWGAKAESRKDCRVHRIQTDAQELNLL